MAGSTGRRAFVGMYGDASERVNAQRIKRTVVQYVPPELKWEAVKRSRFTATFDNVLLTLEITLGRDGNNAVVVGWKSPIAKHDECVQNVEFAMLNADAKRKDYMVKNRTYKNWETGWLLMNDRPDDLEDYMALKPEMVDLRRR